MPPENILNMEWEICPECEGVGTLDASAPEDPPWSCEVTCWRCQGDTGWPIDDDESPEEISES